MGRASEYRRKAAAQLTEVTVPSGAVFLVREYSPEGWLMTGHAPEHLIRTFVEMQKKGEFRIEEVVEEPGALNKFGELMQAVVSHCCVDPVVKLTPANENELGAREIEFADLNHLFLYLTKQLPDSTVRTDTREVAVAAVSNFRDPVGGQGIAGAGSDSAEVRSETKSVIGHS